MAQNSNIELAELTYDRSHYTRYALIASRFHYSASPTCTTARTALRSNKASSYR